MCKQARIMEDDPCRALIRVAEPGGPTQTVTAEEATPELSRKVLGEVLAESLA